MKSLISTISIKFPEMTRTFTLGEGDYLDLDKMKACDPEAWENVPNWVRIKLIDEKKQLIVLDTPVFFENEIVLRINDLYEATSKINGKKYSFALKGISVSSIDNN